jgi:hypothetical protein
VFDVIKSVLMYSEYSKLKILISIRVFLLICIDATAVKTVPADSILVLKDKKLLSVNLCRFEK